MNFICCNVKYSTCDPETYMYIKRYKLSRPSKKSVKNKNVLREIVYVLDCFKCSDSFGGKKIQIRRFGKVDNKSIELERKDLSGKYAKRYLRDNEKFMIEMPQLTPFKKYHVFTKYIPMTYVQHIKTLSNGIEIDIARKRYINNVDYAGDEIICPVVKI